MKRDTILVVEDDLFVSSLLRMLLERAGYEVVTADDGEEGLRVFQKHRSRISLLLTDIRMPHMNGMDLADRVLQLDSHLPVLFMSGETSLPHLHAGYLKKPFNSTDLIGRVAQVLNGPSPGGERDRP